MSEQMHKAVGTYAVLDALTKRRSRRFGLGMQTAREPLGMAIAKQLPDRYVQRQYQRRSSTLTRLLLFWKCVTTESPRLVTLQWKKTILGGSFYVQQTYD